MMPIIKALNHHRYFISAKREKEGKKKEKKIIKEFTPQPAVEEAGRGATSLTRPVKNCQVSNLGPLGASATSGYPLRRPPVRGMIKSSSVLYTHFSILGTLFVIINLAPDHHCT